MIWVAAIMLAGVGQATATTDADLRGTWVNAFPTNHVVPIFGTVEWINVKFATNGTVVWTWRRDGKSETNSGTYRLIAVADRPSLRPIFDIFIHPTSMAVWRDITLSDVTVDPDNRFPVSWMVLKWLDEAKNQMTFIRQEDDKKRRTTGGTLRRYPRDFRG